MFAILAPLGGFLVSMVGPLVTQLLFRLGIGLVTGGSVLLLINGLLSQAKSTYSQFPVIVATFLDMAGFGIGLGMLAGAIAFRVSLDAAGTFSKLPTQ